MGGLVGLVVAVACARMPEQADHPDLPPASERALSAPVDEHIPASSSGSPPSARSDEERAVDASPAALFREALRQLQRGTREKPVRIVWLGDSHTAADFWTGEVRRVLHARFGDGGPGFVPIGLHGVRHEGVTVKSFGTWRQEPRVSAGRHLQLDGRFGLAGRRAIGDVGDGAVVRVNWGDYERLRWEVHYRGSNRAQLVLNAGRAEAVSSRGSSPNNTASRWQISDIVATQPELRIKVVSGHVQLLGLFGEASPPGVVLDSLGINGARLATLLAWDEADWEAHLRARRPDLVVLAYGTNEAGDRTDVNDYYPHYERVVEHIRAAGAVCLLVGPTDRQNDAGVSLERVEELDQFLEGAAEQLGCLFFSAYRAMGGFGGFGRWRNLSPPLAARDGVHLTVSGYRRLAQHFVEFLTP